MVTQGKLRSDIRKESFSVVCSAVFCVSHLVFSVSQEAGPAECPGTHDEAGVRPSGAYSALQISSDKLLHSFSSALLLLIVPGDFCTVPYLPVQ